MTTPAHARTLILLGTILLALSATNALPADTWIAKIREYTNNRYALVQVKKTPDVVLVYLCQPNGNAWWAYKLTDETLRDANILLKGYAVYNTYNARGQQHGQGVFFGRENGPMFERASVPNEHVPPSGFAEITIVARNNAQQQLTYSLGRISADTARELSQKCLSSSFPRVLHKCVPVGHAAPCRPAS